VLPEGFRDGGIQCLESRVRVWSQQAIVGDKEKLIATESQASRQLGFSLKPLRCHDGRVEDRPQAFTEAPRQRLLAEVLQSRSPVRLIGVDVRFVRYQKNSRSIPYMAVVCNVHEQMILHRLFLNPPMEHANEILLVNGKLLGKQLDPDSLQISYRAQWKPLLGGVKWSAAGTSSISSFLASVSYRQIIHSGSGL